MHSEFVIRSLSEYQRILLRVQHNAFVTVERASRYFRLYCVFLSPSVFLELNISEDLVP